MTIKGLTINRSHQSQFLETVESMLCSASIGCTKRHSKNNCTSSKLVCKYYTGPFIELKPDFEVNVHFISHPLGELDFGVIRFLPLIIYSLSYKMEIK